MKKEIEKLLGKSKYSFDDLVEIMKILRGEDGCPWDKEQTHTSIRKNIIEETYEVCEAIDNNDNESLQEELGDLLLQVVFHAKIAEDEKAFDINNVADNICKKLIRRHPHIFSDVVAGTSEKVLQNWDEIKKQEKNIKKLSESIAAVPRQLPALMRADKLQQRAAKIGFDWDDYKDPADKLEEEGKELFAAIDKKDNAEIFKEYGDLLFSAVNLGRKLGLDSEEALTVASDKFSSRLLWMEENAETKLADLPLSELDKLWERAKNFEVKEK